MDKSDEATFRAHLDASAEGSPRCPVCATDKWLPFGPLELRKDVEPGQLATMPLVMLICVKCFYVLHFAWNPIARGIQSPLRAGGDGGR